LAETFKTNFNTALIIDTIQEVDLGAKEVAKSFGLGAESVLEIKTAMADAVKEVAIYGKTFKDIADLQEKIGESVGRNIIMSTDNYSKLFSTSQVTGQDASKLVKDLKDAGISLYNVNTEMQSVIDSAREMGVNASVVASTVLNNLA
jgi:uridine phosphorylase